MKNFSNMGLDEKLQYLKKVHRNSHPDAIEQISAFEERLVRLQVSQEWLTHPSTVELKQISIEQINAINKILMGERDIAEMERHVLFEKRDNHMKYFSILSADHKSEMDSIERAVNEII